MTRTPTPYKSIMRRFASIYKC